MFCSSPVLTATRAALRFQPVAKAFGSGCWKMPTSGMVRPTVRAWRSTTPSSQRPVASVVCGSMTCTPMARLAMVLDINSEMNEPPKPNRAAKTSSPV